MLKSVPQCSAVRLTCLWDGYGLEAVLGGVCANYAQDRSVQAKSGEHDAEHSGVYR